MAVDGLARIGMLTLDRWRGQDRELYRPDLLDWRVRLAPTTYSKSAVGVAPGCGNLQRIVPDEVIWGRDGYGGRYLLIFPERRMVAGYARSRIDKFVGHLTIQAAIV